MAWPDRAHVDKTSWAASRRPVRVIPGHGGGQSARLFAGLERPRARFRASASPATARRRGGIGQTAGSL